MFGKLTFTLWNLEQDLIRRQCFWILHLALLPAVVHVPLKPEQLIVHVVIDIKQVGGNFSVLYNTNQLQHSCLHLLAGFTNFKKKLLVFWMLLE